MSTATTGFWGPSTSTVDWCETNYEHLFHVSELFNSASSLVLVLAGLAGIALHRRVLERRFLLAFALLSVVGVGSTAFHATLRREHQMLDELPMLYLAIVIVYILLEDRPQRRFGNWFPGLLLAHAVLVTYLTAFTRGSVQFFLFQASFASLEFFALGRTWFLQRRSPDPRVKRLFRLGIGAYALAIVLWLSDIQFCPTLNGTLPALGLPNPQFHAWWHVLVSCGFYALLLVIAHDRLRTLGQEPRLGVAAGWIPRIAHARRASQGQKEESRMHAEDGKSTARGAAASNHFAFTLYRHAGARHENTFLSPASIAVALAMTDLGARGKTQEEMERVLGRDVLKRASFHEAYSALHGRLVAAGQDQGVELLLANQLWAQRGYPFLESFLEATRARYAAPLEEVDFAGAPEPTRLKLNQRVSEQTRGKVAELIPAGVLTPLTRLVLTNAIYFKGQWQARFDKEETREADFHLSADTRVPVPMMSRSGRYRLGQGDTAQWLELPYVGGQVAMLVVLPRDADGLPGVEAALDAKTLEQKVSAMTEQPVDVSLPRFKLAAAFELKEALSRLGMPRAFDAQLADFSGMTADPVGLVVSKVLHQANIDVNEEGSEAAAATAVVVKTRSVSRRTHFNADRPFLFLLRDTQSGAVLFLGKVVDPRR